MYYFLQTQRMKILSLGPDGRTRVESKLLLSYCVLLLARVCILCILASSYGSIFIIIIFYSSYSRVRELRARMNEPGNARGSIHTLCMCM